jgi:hypothetical protein
LIEARTKKKHHLLVKEVVKRLAENDLLKSPEKYIWSSERAECLGYVITLDGTEMDEDKIEGIKEWQAPRSLSDVQFFLRLVNFYRRLTKDFSRICRSVTESRKGETKNWHRMPEMEKSFQELKNWLTTALILTHFDLTKICIVEPDASDFTLGAIFSQKDNEGRLHPIGFHLLKFPAAEINYEVHDKELLAIIDSFKVWHRYLEGSLCTVIVYRDNQNLEYFTTTEFLNRKEPSWA